MFTAALLTIAKRWKQNVSVDEWINKMWSIHTMGYYPALKRKGVLTQATIWMSLEDILLRGTRQSQKDKSCRIPPIGQIHRHRK